MFQAEWVDNSFISKMAESELLFQKGRNILLTATIGLKSGYCRSSAVRNEKSHSEC
jgi:hypothetical protein